MRRETVLWFFAVKDGEELYGKERGSFSGERAAPSAPVEAGSEYDVTIEDIAREGDGIARIEGFAIFVPGTQVGDKIKISVDKVMRRFAIGHKV